MKTSRLFVLFVTIILAGLLSACGGQASASWPGVSVDEENAYLAFNQYVFAIDLETGQPVWRFPEEPIQNITFYAPPAIGEDGQIVFGSYIAQAATPRLYSVNNHDQERWVYNEEGKFFVAKEDWVFDQAGNHFIAKPLITPDGVYASNADGNLYKLDWNGQKIWSFPTNRAIWASPATNETCDCIFVASMDHHLYAVDAKTGLEKWSSEDLGGALAAEPLFGEGNVIYLGTSGNQLLALNAEDGSEIWSFETAGWVWSGVTLQDGILYFGDLDHNLYAVQADTGNQLWKLATDGAILSKPLVANDTLYYTTETANLYAVNLDGTPKWSQATKAPVYAPVIAAGDLILVAVTDVKEPLAAYDLDGRPVWTFVVPE